MLTVESGKWMQWTCHFRVVSISDRCCSFSSSCFFAASFLSSLPSFTTTIVAFRTPWQLITALTLASSRALSHRQISPFARFLHQSTSVFFPTYTLTSKFTQQITFFLKMLCDFRVTSRPAAGTSFTQPVRERNVLCGGYSFQC